ncbi:hypothetical protein KOR42_33480 [Thalassoglobus neptunius]|uniref:Uncharacterized protein n=2 Tax=Thalassoglobus neptunius TaxID=1938619 RepID=A0A5C5WM38_9PLAN|nr:hypothetical protein KOR42_33480 [Thalassoglobus neptunius]
MAISFKCSCGRGFKVPDEAAGKKMKCKECGEVVQVPSPKVKQKVAAPPACEDDYGMNFGLKEDPILQELPPRKRRADDEPKRKKGSKSKKQNSNTGIKVAVGVGALLIAGIGGFFAVQNMGGGSSGPKQPEVVNYSTFEHDLGQFNIKYPSDWEVESGGGQGGRPPFATFEDGTARISVRHSRSGAPIADMASLPAGGPIIPGEAPVDELPPAAKVHEFLTQKQFELDYSDYEETPGEEFDVPYGTGWLVEFTGSEGFGGKMRAYRLTLVGSQWQYNVVAKCPNNRWDKYEPIFKEVISSIAR